jgi:hypothetical protein
MLEVLFFSLGVNEYINKVANHKFVHVELMDRGLRGHKAHKGGPSIGKAEGHDSEFIQAILGLEGCLVTVIWVNPALMVSRP